jgi:hypothetical protein
MEQNKSEKCLSLLDKIALVLAISSGPVIFFSRNDLQPYLMLLAIVPAVYLAVRAFKTLRKLRRKEKSVKPFESFYNLNLWVQLVINSIATVGNLLGGIYLLVTAES